jgi:chromosome partitioning protein
LASTHRAGNAHAMAAKVIVVAGSKGGVGKSTICAHLASEWTSRGVRVLVVDADPQQSLMEWSEAAETPVCDVVSMGDNIRKTLPSVAESYDLVLVDTPARQSARLAGVLMVADFALCPTMPGTTDLWAVPKTLEVIDNVRQLRELNAAFLVNCKDATVIARNAATSLCDADVAVLGRTVGKRVAFSEAMTSGQGINTYAPGGIAALEISNLADELENHLEMRTQGNAA